MNKKENEFIVFICKNNFKKSFHSLKVSFKVSMLIPIAKINLSNILISAWFAKVNLAKHNFFYCWFVKANPAIIYPKLINTQGNTLQEYQRFMLSLGQRKQLDSLPSKLWLASTKIS